MLNISMLITSTIWLTFDLSVSSVPRLCLYMLGSSTLTQVFCMCKTVLHPLYVNVESITPDHHEVLRNDELWQRCIPGRTLLSWNLVKGSSYSATAVLSKIRCIKDKHHMQSKYVTWYGHYHLVLLISISKAPAWSPSSPAWHHDLHHRVVTWLSRQLLLLQLLLTHRDKVKQLHGVCISYNKETTIRLLPVANRLKSMIIS